MDALFAAATSTEHTVKHIQMPKLKPETQQARRDEILDASERCFARAGFHRTTMQDICREADVSPGALYVYFDSKEALIAGLCERDRTEFAEKLDVLADVPDFLAALNSIAENYFHEQPAHKRLMAVEMAVEATRNPRIEAICRPVDRFVSDGFLKLFTRLQAEGRIAPALDIRSLTEVFKVMGDGLFWRRAVDPDFDARAVLPGMMTVLHGLLNPVEVTAKPNKRRQLTPPRAGQTSPKHNEKQKVGS
jgi:TetR/AcrR family transcriptional regulator, repressor for uid operon